MIIMLKAGRGIKQVIFGAGEAIPGKIMKRISIRHYKTDDVRGWDYDGYSWGWFESRKKLEENWKKTIEILGKMSSCLEVNK